MLLAMVVVLAAAVAAVIMITVTVIMIAVAVIMIAVAAMVVVVVVAKVAAALNTVVVAAAMIAAKVAAAHRITHIMMEAHNLFPPQIAAALDSVMLAAYLTFPTPMPALKSLLLYMAAAKNSIHLQAAGQVISPLSFLFLSREYYS